MTPESIESNSLEILCKWATETRGRHFTLSYVNENWQLRLSEIRSQSDDWDGDSWIIIVYKTGQRLKWPNNTGYHVTNLQ